MSENLFDQGKQWHATSLQVVNWGGFEGAHRIELSTGVTLVSGASGTGKSTVLDAFTATLMPSDIAFNGASNDAVSGRARSDEQRNVASYLRGKIDDETEAGTGDVTARVLRGADGPTWGAVGVTFTSTTGDVLTAFRAYYLPRGAGRISSDGTTKMALSDGNIDLADLADVVGSKFDKRGLEKRFPGILVASSYSEFSERLFIRLGIGQHGNGMKALRLLARIQAGHAVKSVDDLYKSMVLETPDTYRAADRALEHFQDLEDAYEAMEDEHNKLKVLSTIEADYTAMELAAQNADMVDSFGVSRDGDTPWIIWCAEAEAAMLIEAERTNSAHRADALDRAKSAGEDERALETRKASIEAEKHEAGGGELTRLDHDIADLTEQAERARQAKVTFDLFTQALDTPLESREQLDATRVTAQAFLDTFDRQKNLLAEERAALVRESYPVSAEIQELKDERASLDGRDGRVGRDLHEARLAIAQAAGLDPSAFAFVAELVDVPKEHEEWRTAIETTLYGLARVLLIDERDLERVSRAIDPVTLRVRVNFQAVPTRDYVEPSADPAMISGKLRYKPGPYTAWVVDRIASSGIDHRCVDGPSELAGSDRRVTRSGQTRHGKAGAHGSSRGAHIIGFTSEERIAEINERLAELEVLSTQQGDQVQELASRETHLGDLRGAYQQVVSTPWSSIDVQGILDAIEERKARKAAILASNDRLAALDAELDGTVTQLEAARSRKHLAAGELSALERVHGELVDRSDLLQNTLERIAVAGRVHLTDDQRARLDAMHAQHGSPGNLDDFDKDRSRIKDAAGAESKAERDKVTERADALAKAFETFNTSWPDPSRGTALTDYPDFLEIVQHIQQTGLVERRAEWTRRVADWTGQDLVPLAGAFASSIEDIEDRLLPVNEILRRLDFGAHRRHLNITLRRLVNEEVRTFQATLRKLASGTTSDMSETAVHDRFMALRDFLNPLRTTPTAYPTPSGKARPAPPSRRDALLDVRRHVKITAQALDDAGVAQATYDLLGQKSGGESQELISFIVGAALTYQLGDAESPVPTYTLITMDEAFIKADSEFTGRAVAAWKGLGFQLLISAPNEKTSGLEPHVDSIVAITKSPQGYSRATHIRRADEPVPE